MKKLVCVVLTLVMTLSLGVSLAQSEATFEPMKLTFSMTEAEGGVVADGILLMKNYLEEKTDGKVTMDTFFASSLMAQDMEIESIMKGTLDMNSCWFDWLSPYMPKLEVLNVPYLFSSWDHMNSFFESEQAAQLCDEIAQTTGVRVFTPVYYKGARTVNLNKDIKVTSREDLKGIKIRMPNSEAWQYMGEALGANPVPLGVSELYLSLQTGAVDGQDNGFSTTRSFSFHEVTKSITVTGHMIGAGFISISEKQWQKMSPELQQIVLDAVKLGCNNITQTIQDQEAGDVSFFEEIGLKVYFLTDEELASYRQEVLDYYFSNPSFTDGLDMELYDQIANME